MQDHTVPHWKALRYGKDNSRGLSCISTLNIHQGVLKSGNLLHKRGFVDSQLNCTVPLHNVESVRLQQILQSEESAHLHRILRSEEGVNYHF